MQLKEEDVIWQKCKEVALLFSGYGIGKSLVWKQNGWLCNE